MMHLGLARTPNTIYKALVCQPRLIPHHLEQHNIPSTQTSSSLIYCKVLTQATTPLPPHIQ